MTSMQMLTQDYPFKVNLLDWLMVMVGSCWQSDKVIDPSIGMKSSTRALKRELLIATERVDAYAHKRPKMCPVVRMLDADEPIHRIRPHHALHSSLQIKIRCKYIWHYDITSSNIIE